MNLSKLIIMCMNLSKLKIIKIFKKNVPFKINKYLFTLFFRHFMILGLYPGFILFILKIYFAVNLRNKSPFYIFFTPRMMSNRQLPIYIYFHLILSIRLAL